MFRVRRLGTLTNQVSIIPIVCRVGGNWIPRARDMTLKVEVASTRLRYISKILLSLTHMTYSRSQVLDFLMTIDRVPKTLRVHKCDQVSNISRKIFIKLFLPLAIPWWGTLMASFFPSSPSTSLFRDDSYHVWKISSLSAEAINLHYFAHAIENNHLQSSLNVGMNVTLTNNVWNHVPSKVCMSIPFPSTAFPSTSNVIYKVESTISPTNLIH